MAGGVLRRSGGNPLSHGFAVPAPPEGKPRAFRTVLAPRIYEGGEPRSGRGSPPPQRREPSQSRFARQLSRRESRGGCAPITGHSHASDRSHWRQRVKKASQSLPPAGGKGILIIFCRGVYLTENTTQAASVRLVRCKRTRRARSSLQSFCQKRAKPFFDSLTPVIEVTGVRIPRMKGTAERKYAQGRQSCRPCACFRLKCFRPGLNLPEGAGGWLRIPCGRTICPFCR